MSTHPARVLVVSPNWLGDAVLALPAVADLRRAFPEARLTVAARASVAGLFHLVPGVDDVQVLEWRGDRRGRRAWRADVSRLRGVRADLAVLLPNSFASAWAVWWARIPERWGYAGDLRGWLLTRAVRRPRTSLHQGRYYQHLLDSLGVRSGPLEPRIEVPPQAMAAVRQHLLEQGWERDRPLVVVAPGAAYGTAKRWTPAHVSRLIHDLIVCRRVTCVLVGSGADAETTALVRAGVPDEARRHVVDLAGRTTLPMLAAALSLADACVSNDSGAMHLAAAAGTPLAAVFGPTNEAETAPLPARGARAQVLIHPVSCRPCMLRECPIDHRCMTGLEPSRVYAVVDAFLTTAREARVESDPRRGLSHGSGAEP